MYLSLRESHLQPIDGVDVARIEKLARIVRGLAFAAIDSARSGHPGGSSSKVEQILALLFSGVLAFDPLDPKHAGRDRLVWSTGHCSPLFHATLALIYEALRKQGKISLEDGKKLGAVFGEDLVRFRHIDGPSGHVESRYALADASTGASGHGFSAALGLALLQKSNSLPAKVFVIAGDAETEEGISYEARNSAVSMGADNIIVSLDYNGFGIDGSISDVIQSPYLNHWLTFGWNVIEVNGHNVLELVHAYKKAYASFNNQKPTVIICHTTKGKFYGKLEGTADSHGAPLPHQEYIEVMNNLGFNVPDNVPDIEVLSHLTQEDVDYIAGRMEITKNNIKAERGLLAEMEEALHNRPMVDYKKIQRPDVLPLELIFKEGDLVPTRKATEIFFKWLMEQTAFCYIGAGDLMKSVLTGAAENVYGVINKDNPLGRGFRFGIAEPNMAMMATALTQDILPGGFQAMSIFTSYGVFTSMMSNSVRMALINNAVNPDRKGFFIMMAAHDGPETGEDGPTHHGLFWMSLFNAYPGIKVYKPLDANETIEMLFHALSVGEPIALSVMRPATLVFKRDGYVPSAREAINGAYVFKPFDEDGHQKIVLAVCGGQIMANTMEILPDLCDQGLDVKIIAVTSPELYEELAERDPQKAQSILSDDERQYVVTLHNGWPGFLYPFILPANYRQRALGISQFQKSGSPKEIYESAGFDPQSIKEKILSIV
ncbi:MAG: 1-deoxy-D-xylulose-5-phosphate synthase N-terminal domain-containing protein [Patescibacteria group bacterium]